MLRGLTPDQLASAPDGWVLGACMRVCQPRSHMSARSSQNDRSADLHFDLSLMNMFCLVLEPHRGLLHLGQALLHIAISA